MAEVPKKKWGGKQEGAGRPKGAVSVRTKFIRAVSNEAIEDGVVPLEVMLDNMRFYHEKAVVLQTAIVKDIGKKPPMELLEALKELGSFRDSAQKCAVDAAPYVHPRLSSTTVDANVTHKVEEAEDAFKTIEGVLESMATGAEIIPPKRAKEKV